MNATQKNNRRGRLIAAAAAVLLVVGGGAAIGTGIWGNQPPPQPPRSAAAPQTPAASAQPAIPAPTASTPPSPIAAPIVGPILPPSAPTHIDVPAIGVSSGLMDLGLNADGTVQVPPLDKSAPAGWYQNSPTPGQLGPSIILGHVDSVAEGPSVFFRLGDIRAGDQVSVTRTDNTVAVFAVEKVERYPKDNFPQLAVYGNTDHAALRLITCGGVFNSDTGHYVDNIVVYASLVSSHPA
ncbi:MAG: class F sortase [Microbacteriaceae bacterium]